MKGFSLIEILVAISISSILLVGMVRFMGTAIPLYRSTFMQTMADETARVQLKRMAREIRSALPSDAGAFPIVEASASRLIFYANVDSDSSAERVRYELVDTTMVRGVTQPTGNPIVYNVAQESATTVARSIQNGSNPVFMYYDSTYPSSTTPVPSGSVASVTYISFSLTIDADTNNDPPAIVIQSQVQLRNRKTNL